MDADRFLSSPLQRARRTAELAMPGAFVETDDDLMEWDYGVYEGRRTADIEVERPGWRLFRDGCPGGETLDYVGARADRRLGLQDAGPADDGVEHSVPHCSGHFGLRSYTRSRGDGRNPRAVTGLHHGPRHPARPRVALSRAWRVDAVGRRRRPAGLPRAAETALPSRRAGRGEPAGRSAELTGRALLLQDESLKPGW